MGRALVKHIVTLSHIVRSRRAKATEVVNYAPSSLVSSEYDCTFWFDRGHTRCTARNSNWMVQQVEIELIQLVPMYVCIEGVNPHEFNTKEKFLWSNAFVKTESCGIT